LVRSVKSVQLTSTVRADAPAIRKRVRGENLKRNPMEKPTIKALYSQTLRRGSPFFIPSKRLKLIVTSQERIPAKPRFMLRKEQKRRTAPINPLLMKKRVD
jgi:hypothetical protein